MNYIGKKIYSRGRKEVGVITMKSERYCAACGIHSCYIVKWNDGKTTKPCTHGVKQNGTDLEIE